MKPVKTAGTAAAVCSLAGVGLLPRLLDWGIDATHSAGMLLLAGLLWTAGKAVLSEKDRRLLRFSLTFGLVFAFCQLLGARLDSAIVAGGESCLCSGGRGTVSSAGEGNGWRCRRFERRRVHTRTDVLDDVCGAASVLAALLSGLFSRYVQLRLGRGSGAVHHRPVQRSFSAAAYAATGGVLPAGRRDGQL